MGGVDTENGRVLRDGGRMKGRKRDRSEICVRGRQEEEGGKACEIA